MEMIVNPTLKLASMEALVRIEHVHTCSQYQDHCTCPSGYTSKNCEQTESDRGDGGGSPGGGPQPIGVDGGILPSDDGFDSISIIIERH